MAQQLSAFHRAAVRVAAATLVLGVAPALAATTASAAPAEDAKVTQAQQGPGQRQDITVYSPSMKRQIPLEVLVPTAAAKGDAETPVLYLLNGTGGGEDSATWTAQTNAADFFLDKNVYVVTPMEGAFSYYTDWLEPDPTLAKNLGNNGINMWTTFLTEELPPAIDAHYKTSGENAIAGISMAGSAILDLAIQAEERDAGHGKPLYNSIGAYSGCAMTSDPIGSTFVNIVTGVGGGDTTKMWGPVGGPEWVKHDVYANAEKLPRVPMFISTGSGLPGEHDNLANWRLKGSEPALANQIVVGGVLEAATSGCTQMLKLKTDALGMDNIHYDLPAGGSHSWGYWEDDLHQSWPMLAESMGI